MRRWGETPYLAAMTLDFNMFSMYSSKHIFVKLKTSFFFNSLELLPRLHLFECLIVCARSERRCETKHEPVATAAAKEWVFPRLSLSVKWTGHEACFPAAFCLLMLRVRLWMLAHGVGEFKRPGTRPGVLFCLVWAHGAVVGLLSVVERFCIVGFSCILVIFGQM